MVQRSGGGFYRNLGTGQHEVLALDDCGQRILHINSAEDNSSRSVVGDIDGSGACGNVGEDDLGAVLGNCHASRLEGGNAAFGDVEDNPINLCGWVVGSGGVELSGSLVNIGAIATSHISASLTCAPHHSGYHLFLSHYPCA